MRYSLGKSVLNPLQDLPSYAAGEGYKGTQTPTVPRVPAKAVCYNYATLTTCIRERIVQRKAPPLPTHPSLQPKLAGKGEGGGGGGGGEERGPNLTNEGC